MLCRVLDRRSGLTDNYQQTETRNVKNKHFTPIITEGLGILQIFCNLSNRKQFYKHLSLQEEGTL